MSDTLCVAAMSHTVKLAVPQRPSDAVCGRSERRASSLSSDVSNVLSTCLLGD